MALMDYLIGKKRDAQKDAAPYIEQAKATYQPYQTQGVAAGQNLGGVSSKLLSDPGAYLEDLYKNYSMSDSAKMQEEDALRGAGAAAAAGGFRGTQSDMRNSARVSDLIQGQDRDRYMKELQSLLGIGMQGEQALYAGGLQAAGGLSGVYGTQAGTAAQQAQEANKNRSGLLGALGGLAGGAAGAYFGQTPEAAAAGYKIGSGAGFMDR